MLFYLKYKKYILQNNFVLKEVSIYVDKKIIIKKMAINDLN